MNARDYIQRILPKVIRYKAFRSGVGKVANPITLTYSVTAACQSLCKTCNIGAKFFEDPKRRQQDLRLDEIEKIFKSIGQIYFFNISGGEPFIRKDLPQIIDLACKYLKPRIIHTPTNALMPERIRDLTRQSLETIAAHDRHIPFTVKPSIDGVGAIHDEIRGIKGNFNKLEKTIAYLKELEQNHPNFHLELGTVVSKFNVDHLEKIEDYVHSLEIQSYRNEVAEQRAEFYNLGDPITPDAATYEHLMQSFAAKIRKNLGNKRQLAKVTEALRLAYYDLATRILREKRQVIPCYGGISNIHINYDGGVWPCCVLGYNKEMGSLRDNNYDVQLILRSNQARSVRQYIKDGNCACPLANQSYSNILCSPTYTAKVIRNVVKP